MFIYACTQCIQWYVKEKCHNTLAEFKTILHCLFDPIHSFFYFAVFYFGLIFNAIDLCILVSFSPMILIDLFFYLILLTCFILLLRALCSWNYWSVMTCCQRSGSFLMNNIFRKLLSLKPTWEGFIYHGMTTKKLYKRLNTIFKMRQDAAFKLQQRHAYGRT